MPRLNLTRILAHIERDYEGELKKKADAGEFRYDGHVTLPVMKKLSRSVDEDSLKRYYMPFFDEIIEPNAIILKKRR